MEGFLLYEFGGIFGGAHTWRGLFSEFYSMTPKVCTRSGVFVVIEFRFSS